MGKAIQVPKKVDGKSVCISEAFVNVVTATDLISALETPLNIVSDFLALTHLI